MELWICRIVNAHIGKKMIDIPALKPAQPAAQKSYRFFDLELVSAHPFANLAESSFDDHGKRPDRRLRFDCSPSALDLPDWDTARLISTFHYGSPETDRYDKLYAFPEMAAMRFAWGADFTIKKDQIDCFLRDPANSGLIEMYLGSQIIALWLEQQGLPALHASAVSHAGEAIAFLAYSGSGKSSLALGCLQTGASLLSDDILALENLSGRFAGHVGLPQINLWPDQAAFFIGETGAASPAAEKNRYPLSAFEQAAFCDSARPLACLYLPERYQAPPGSAQIEIKPLPAVQALIELMRYSYVPPYICEQMGWQAQRMDFLARLVEQVPVRRLRYPSGFEHLPAVTDAILRDAQS